MSTPITPGNPNQNITPASKAPQQRNKLTDLYKQSKVELGSSSEQINNISKQEPNLLVEKANTFVAKLLGTSKIMKSELDKDSIKLEHFHIELFTPHADKSSVHVTPFEHKILQSYENKKLHFRIVNHKEKIIFEHESRKIDASKPLSYTFHDNITHEQKQEITDRTEYKIIYLSDDEWQLLKNTLIELSIDEQKKHEKIIESKEVDQKNVNPTQTDHPKSSSSEKPHTEPKRKEVEKDVKTTQSNFIQEENNILSERKKQKHEQMLAEEKEKVKSALKSRDEKIEMVNQEKLQRDAKFWRENSLQKD